MNQIYLIALTAPCSLMQMQNIVMADYQRKWLRIWGLA